MNADELVRAGKLDEALEELKGGVRSEPANAEYRVFLFQLYSILGDWERAINQLNVAADIDKINLLMAQVCRPALNAEALRAEIFEGKRQPVLFGEPADWMTWMIEALSMDAEGHHKAAAELREKALEASPAVAGTIDDQPFEWIADADMRMGPILEAVVNARYYWIPFVQIKELQLEAPSDLRDLVWTPAEFTWVNGGKSVGLIPTRYAASERSDDSAIRMARKTEWIEEGDAPAVGLGQRMLATDQGEFPILETRKIVLENEDAPAVDQAPQA